VPSPVARPTPKACRSSRSPTRRWSIRRRRRARRASPPRASRRNRHLANQRPPG